MSTTLDSAASSPAEQRIGLAAAEVVDRLGRLRVRSRRAIQGPPGGRRRSASSGRSIEFREHRPYARGDDLRLVDWRAWARLDRLYVKQHDAETDLRVTLLVDSSGSMAYGEGTQLKHEYAAVASSALAQVWLQQQDSVGAVRIGDPPEVLPVRRGLAQVSEVIRLVARPVQERPADLGGALRQHAANAPRRSVAVIVSDLLTPLEGLRSGLRALRAAGVRSVVLQVLHDDEVDFPLSGATRFVSLESEQLLDADPRSLRRKYLAELQRHQAGVAAACNESGAVHLFARTSTPIDAVLAELLASVSR